MYNTYIFGINRKSISQLYREWRVGSVYGIWMGLWMVYGRLVGKKEYI